MAVTRRTLKDVGSYEAKFIGPFTIRQSVCLGIGVIPAAFVDYLLYNVTREASLLFVVTVIIMAPAIFMAFGSKVCHDMKPEDFVRDYIKYKIMAPPIRLYETRTRDDEIWEEELKRRKKEDPEAFEEEEQIVEADEKGKKKKGKKGKKSETSESSYKVGNRTFKKYPHKESQTIREAL